TSHRQVPRRKPLMAPAPLGAGGCSAQDLAERTTPRARSCSPCVARKHGLHSGVSPPGCGAKVLHTGEPYQGPRVHRDANGHQRYTSIDGATPGVCARGAVVVQTPGGDILALARGTWAWTVVPPPRLDGGVTRVDGAEVVDGRAHRHGCASPVVVRSR